MVDNAEHSMATGALYLLTGAECWVKALLDGTPRPTFSWTKDNTTGTLTITTTGTQPVKVVNRMTSTLDGYRRDFRLVAGNTPANPCKYIPVPVFGSACLRPMVWIGEDEGVVSLVNTTGTTVGTYILTQDPPEFGWRAWLGELCESTSANWRQLSAIFTKHFPHAFSPSSLLRRLQLHHPWDLFPAHNAGHYTPSARDAPLPLPPLQGGRLHWGPGVEGPFF